MNRIILSIGQNIPQVDIKFYCLPPIPCDVPCGESKNISKYQFVSVLTMIDNSPHTEILEGFHMVLKYIKMI